MYSSRIPSQKEGFPISQPDPFESFSPQSPSPERPGVSCVDLLRRQSGPLALAMICAALIMFCVRLLLVRVGIRNSGLSTLPVYLSAFLLPFWMYGRAVNFHLREIPSRRPVVTILAASAGTMLGVSVVGILLSLVLSRLFAMVGLYPQPSSFTPPTTVLQTVLLFCNLALLPAVFEELTMRGIVLGSLRRFGDGFAILVSAILFALLHRSLAQLPNAFLLGLVFGFYMVKTESIWGCMVLHFLNNLLVTLLSLLTYRMPEWQAFLCEGAVFLSYLAFAAAGLIYLVMVRRLDFSLPWRGCPLTTGQLCGVFFTHFPVLMMLVGYGWMIYLHFGRFAI